ncbi:hypothetical protein V8F20_008204, partial [Naviculisporaceae sp. PSN 640]
MADADLIKPSINSTPHLKKITKIHPDGDLTLVVGAKERRALVCHRVLSRASPVFRVMLTGSFCESRQNFQDGTPWIVRLPEDNWRATHILLCIIHGKLADLPADLPIQTLYNLLVVTDKYDMTKFIIPWAKSWVPKKYHVHHSTYRVCGLTYLLWITVAWELGHRELFERGLRGAIVDFWTDRDGILFSWGNTSRWRVAFEAELDLALFPRGLFEKIASAREKIASIFMDSMRQVIRGLEYQLAS